MRLLILPFFQFNHFSFLLKCHGCVKIFLTSQSVTLVTFHIDSGHFLADRGADTFVYKF